MKDQVSDRVGRPNGVVSTGDIGWVERRGHFTATDTGHDVGRPVQRGCQTRCPVVRAVIPQASVFPHRGPDGEHLPRQVSLGLLGSGAPLSDHLRIGQNVDVQEPNLFERFLAVMMVVPSERLDVWHCLGEVHRAAIHPTIKEPAGLAAIIDQRSGPAAGLRPTAAGAVAHD